MRQRYYNSTIKRFINQDVLIGEIHNSQSLNRYAYVQGNPVNYTDPFGLNPVHILKAYSGVVHDILNVASVIPGPVGAVSGLINAGIYALEGEYGAAAKCAIQAGLTAFIGPLAGAAIGGLCKLSTAARVITGIAAIGAGMYAVGTSAYELHESALNFVDELTKEGGGDPLQLFHYFSNMLVNIAGVSYGVTGIAGGISMFDGITSSGGSQVKPKQQSETSIIENEGGSKLDLADYYEYKALKQQGYNASEAYGLMKQFRDGINPNDDFIFHFTTYEGGKGITDIGGIKGSKSGFGGKGIYAGTTPTPSWALKHIPIGGWGLGKAPVRIPIKITPNMEIKTPILPLFKTRVIPTDFIDFN